VPKLKGADVFIRALENEGVQYIFDVPGEENLDLLESFHGSTIQLVVTWHEQAAALMAATYGCLTRKPGVCKPLDRTAWLLRPLDLNPVEFLASPQAERSGEPTVWFHDMFHPDGKPYRQRETEIIRKLTERP
jgi:thiamine pyrophosphate-dependent enzyme